MKKQKGSGRADRDKAWEGENMERETRETIAMRDGRVQAEERAQAEK